MTPIRFSALAATAALALVLTACTSGEEESGIASLAESTVAAEGTAVEGTAEEQALAFAQCMRDNGVDFPDPTVDADGNPSFEGAFGRSEEGGFDPGDTSFRDAMEACGDLMEGLAFGPGGGGAGGGQFDTEAMQEALYTYTSCLRDEGLDVGDIEFGMPGEGGPGGDDAGAAPDAGATAAPELGEAGERPEPAEGQAGPGGDMSDRFAEQLGYDADDPEWIAANEVCQPVLEEAMTSAQGDAAESAS